MRRAAIFVVAMLLVPEIASAQSFSRARTSSSAVQAKDESPPPVASQDGAQAGSQTGTDQSSTGKQLPPCDANTSGSKGCEPAVSTTSRGKTTRSPKTTATPRKKIVREGSTTEPSVAIAPSVSGGQASKELQSTNQLLATSNDRLHQISARKLTRAQQETVTEIKNYIAQARKAADEGDSQRAYNLAHKANLLSSDLLAH